MGDQDRRAACSRGPPSSSRVARRVRTGIDDDCLVRAVVEHGRRSSSSRSGRARIGSLRGSRAFESNGGLSPPLRSRTMQSWNLREIDTPDGTRSPVVLRSDAAARAVLIVARAGTGARRSPGEGTRARLGGRRLGASRGRRRDDRRRRRVLLLVRRGRATLDLDGRRALASCSCSRRGRARATTAATRRRATSASSARRAARGASGTCGRSASR